jgi:hypothetical protein
MRTTSQPLKVLDRIRRIDPGRRMPGGGIRLVEIRKEFPEIRPADLDLILRKLQSDGELVIYRFDNPALITPEDREAEIRFSGVVRHYIFLR